VTGDLYPLAGATLDQDPGFPCCVHCDHDPGYWHARACVTCHGAAEDFS
jgi:hypothetical protein